MRRPLLEAFFVFRVEEAYNPFRQFMTTYLIIGNNVDLAHYPFEKGARLFGVDHGAFKAVSAGLPLDLAYGDFDSVTSEELLQIKAHAKKLIQLNPVKDITDTYGAYLEAKDADSIVILGGITGGRIEHFYALLNLVKADARVSLVDASSSIRRLDARSEPYLVKRDEGKFFSIFSIGLAVVSLRNFAYPLKDYSLKEGDSLGISNQIAPMAKTGEILLKEGSLLLIASKDDNAPLLS
jgi:thiamine pyrophosphokinase